jgi:hypothetical protein
VRAAHAADRRPTAGTVSWEKAVEVENALGHLPTLS